MSDTGRDPTAASWDTYWQGAGEAGAYTGGGSTHPAVVAFWQEFFRDIREHYAEPRIVDIASGNGAVVEHAAEAFGGSLPAFTCVDIAPAAIGTLEQRFAGLTGVVADARSIPLESGAYDVATSQFGVEYAGPDALDEMIRLVAPGGRLALLVHHADGGIYRQCAASREALARLREARFLPLAAKMLETGFAAVRGGDRAAHESATRAYVPALRAAEAILRQYGQHVADGTIVRLYRDIRDIHGRMARYEGAEVLGWLGRLEREIEAYEGRMDSMCRAAVDAAGFDAMVERIRRAGLEIRRAGPLANPATELPLAWELIAARN